MGNQEQGKFTPEELANLERLRARIRGRGHLSVATGPEDSRQIPGSSPAIQKGKGRLREFAERIVPGGLAGGIAGAAVAFVLVAGEDRNAPPLAFPNSTPTPSPSTLVINRAPFSLFQPRVESTLTPLPTATLASVEQPLIPKGIIQETGKVGGETVNLILGKDRNMPYMFQMQNGSPLMGILDKELPKVKVSSLHILLIPHVPAASGLSYGGVDAKYLERKIELSEGVSREEGREPVVIDFIPWRTADDLYVYVSIYGADSQFLSLSRLTLEEYDEINRKVSAGVMRLTLERVYGKVFRDVSQIKEVQSVGADSNVPPALEIVSLPTRTPTAQQR